MNHRGDTINWATNRKGRETVKGSGVSWTGLETWKQHRSFHPEREIYWRTVTFRETRKVRERRQFGGNWNVGAHTTNTQDSDWVKGTFTDTRLELQAGEQKKERKRSNVIPYSQVASRPETRYRLRERQDRDSRVQDGMLIQEEFKIYCEKRMMKDSARGKENMTWEERERELAKTERKDLRQPNKVDLLPFFNKGWVVALPSSSSSGKFETKGERKKIIIEVRCCFDASVASNQGFLIMS